MRSRAAAASSASDLKVISDGSVDVEDNSVGRRIGAGEDGRECREVDVRCLDLVGGRGL